MYKNKKNNIFKILLPTVIAACIALMILSALAASQLYKPNKDAFTSELGRNLALLCKSSDLNLSETQLTMIENMEVRSISYNTDSDGNKMFFAKIRIHTPMSLNQTYTEKPDQYIKSTIEKIPDGDLAEECEIIGLCSDNTPIVDIETVTSLAETAEKAWQNENLSSDKNFEYAVTDMLFPEPFADRVFSEGKTYLPEYDMWLTESSAQFASEGMTVSTDNGLSGDANDIRAAMESIVTPYLCSIRNISFQRSAQKNGWLTLTFDSLDVIGTLSTASKPSISAINKLAGVYSNERVLQMSIDIDVSELASDTGKWKLAFFDLIRAMTKYGSSLNKSSVKVKIPDASQVIAGKPDGIWPVEFKRKKGDGYVLIDVIKTDDAGSETSVLKLFLTDGGSYTVCLSKGKYRLNMAVGSTYYGSTDYFGPNGIYICDTQNIYEIPSMNIKSITVAKHPAESLSITDFLVRQSIDPALIDKSQF